MIYLCVILEFSSTANKTPINKFKKVAVIELETVLEYSITEISVVVEWKTSIPD